MNYKEKKILILDDNPEILEMVQESLIIAGFSNLTSVQSQKEALEQFEEIIRVLSIPMEEITEIIGLMYQQENFLAKKDAFSKNKIFI